MIREIDFNGTVERLNAIIETEGASPNGRWTEDEDAILRKFYKRVPTRILAKEIGRSVNAIHRRASASGLSCSSS